MVKKSRVLKLGIAAILVSLLCLGPAMADVTPVYCYFNFPCTQIGSIAYSVLADKPVYSAGEVITYIFQLCLTSCDATTSFDIDHVLDLGVTLDPHITDITSNADYWLTGGGNGISGNSGFFYDSGGSLAWGWGFPPMIYDLTNNDWATGPALVVSGIISPNTPSGTKIKTSSYVDINVNDQNSQNWENQYTDATDTSTVTVAPEFPTPALPVGIILGVLGAALVIRKRTCN